MSLGLLEVPAFCVRSAVKSPFLLIKHDSDRVHAQRFVEMQWFKFEKTNRKKVTTSVQKQGPNTRKV